MEPWEVWIRGTALSEFVLRHEPMLWPAMEMLHYLGLSLLFGTVILFDLRVLGAFKAMPPATLHRWIPWGIAGFALNGTTGAAFFSAHPEQYAYNAAFHWKIVFLCLAALNVLAFYTTVYRDLKQLPAHAAVPKRAKILTAISLLSWSGVLVCGRLLTFYRPPFIH
jgi:hypothetical protein